jgi:single-stranded-DNA-specific exonuclease
MNRRWLISRTNSEYVNYLSKAASLSPIFARVLINRGIKTPGDIADFLNPGLTNLSDPFELPDMKTAVERIKIAQRRNERILVHGDYDTDGLTATAILVQALKSAGVDANYFIPNRMSDGYGFNPPAVALAKKIGARIIVTVDCGIASFEAARSAKEQGIDLIVTDHHEPSIKNAEIKARGSERKNEADDFELPEAIAIVNPKLNRRNPKLSTLSGAGIAFKVAQALGADGTLPFSSDDAMRLLDLAALGTVADVVPLVGENRTITKEGLKCIQEADRPGIRALISVSGLGERTIKSGLLSFTIVPRINASGRIGDSADVIVLLLSDSTDETFSLAEKLDRTNTERQRIEEEVYQEALSQLNKKGYDSAIVLFGEDWHIGVIGIVASRIAEKFNRPTFVFTMEDNVAKGSVRSIPSFDVYSGLSSCSDVLISFGGHRQAAGVKLEAADILRFEERMNEVVKGTLQREDFLPTIEIDSEVALSSVNASLIREFSMLEPVGAGNRDPILGARRLVFQNQRVVGSKHLKLRMRQRSLSMDAIGFDMGNFLERLDSLTLLDAAFTPVMNEWNNNKHIQLTLKAIRPSD